MCVSSPIGTRASTYLIYRDCELEISGILLTVDLRVMDMSKFSIILRMDLLTAYRVVIDCERRRVSTYTLDGNYVTYQGDKHDALLHTVYNSRWHRQLVGWLTSLTQEDEVGSDSDLSQVVCEYEDVFPDELPRLHLQTDVDFCIDLHPGTSLISMTPHRWCQLSCRNSESRYMSYWTRDSFDRALHHGALLFCLQEEGQDPSTVH